MKIILSAPLILLLITLFSCNAKISKEDAMDYYKKIKYENITPCFQLMMEQNKKINEYGKAALQKDPKVLTNEQNFELIKREKAIIIGLKKAIDILTSIEYLGDKTNLKSKSLEYLDDLLDFQENSISPAIEIFEEGIKDNEIEELIKKLSYVSKIKVASTKYKGIEIDFLKEVGITNKEVGELNKEYGF